MLFMTRRETGARLCDINREAIDAFYHKHLTFDASSPDAKRFIEILDFVTSRLSDGKRKKVIGHEAIHVVLLVDSLWNDYTNGWTDKLANAFDLFRLNVTKDAATRWDAKPGEFWLRYGQWTRTNSDRADTITRRHQFILERMHGWLKPQLKDSTRLFGQLEREIIYHRDKKQCQVPGCGAEVVWAEAEFHHVEPHSMGGPTIIDNGALVHKDCHPKSASAMVKFAEHWKAKRVAETVVPTSDADVDTATI